MVLVTLPAFLEALAETEFGRALVTFVVSMVPVIELRGAIPIGVGLGMKPLAAAAVAVVGNMVPVPLIILFIRYVFDWMKRRGGFLGKVAMKLEKLGSNKSSALQKGEFFGLLILVAIPLPGTGAWTGALVASMLDMRMKNALPAISLGVVIAGVVVTGITVGFGHLLG